MESKIRLTDLFESMRLDDQDNMVLRFSNGSIYKAPFSHSFYKVNYTAKDGKRIFKTFFILSAPRWESKKEIRDIIVDIIDSNITLPKDFSNKKLNEKFIQEVNNFKSKIRDSYLVK